MASAAGAALATLGGMAALGSGTAPAHPAAAHPAAAHAPIGGHADSGTNVGHQFDGVE